MSGYTKGRVIRGAKNDRKARSSTLTIAVALLSLGSLAVASPAAAQDAAATPAPTPAAEQDDGTIVVTARRVSETLQDVPLSVSAFNENTLEERQVSQLVDVVRLTPGVQVAQGTSSSFTTALQSRGQTQAANIQTFEPAIGVYENQVYIGNLTGLAGLGLLDVSRVEILRGPQGTLYGRNTTGGAFSLYTNQPTYDVGGSVELSAGTRGLFSGHGVINFPIVDGVAALRVVVGASTQDGFARNDYLGNELRATDSQFLRATLRIDPNPNLNITLLGEIQRGRDSGQDWHILGLLPRSTFAAELAVQAGIMPASRIPAFLAGTATTEIAAVQALVASRLPGIGGDRDVTRNTFDNSQEFRSDFFSSVISLDLGSATLKSLTGYRRVLDDNGGIDFDGTEFIGLDTQFGDALNNGILAAQGVRPGIITGFKMFAQDFNLSGELGRLSYTAGVFYHHSDQLDTSTTNILPNVGGPAGNPSIIEFYSTSQSYAAYGQATYAILDNLRITAGLRYTDESKTLDARSRTAARCNVPPPATLANCRADYDYSDSNVSWTFGLDWRPVEGILLYAKTDRGFRSGGINGRTTADPVSVIPFASEVVDAYEAGFRSSFANNRLVLNVAGYFNDYQNIQQSVVVAGQVGGSPTTVVQNAATAEIWGIEAELHARPVRGLEIAGTLTFTDAKYLEYRDPRTGADLSQTEFPNLSRWQYSIFAQYTTPLQNLGDLSFNLDWTHRSTFNLAPTGAHPTTISQRPGYGILNGRITLATASGFDLSLWTRNLANKRVITYVQSIASLGTSAGGYNEPRTIGVTLSRRF